jgi:hypothetical protein
MNKKPGRPKSERKIKDKTISIYLDQEEFLNELGCSRWIREQIDKEKEKRES